MDKEDIQGVLNLYNKELCATIYQWQEHPSEKVLVAYAELQRRGFACHEQTLKCLPEFANHHGFDHVDIFLEHFLKEQDADSYEDFVGQLALEMKASADYEPDRETYEERSARKAKLSADITKIIVVGLLMTGIPFLLQKCAKEKFSSADLERIEKKSEAFVEKDSNEPRP